MLVLTDFKRLIKNSPTVTKADLDKQRRNYLYLFVLIKLIKQIAITKS